MKQWLRKFKPLLVGIGAFIGAHCLDIISTELVMAFVPGAIEQNPLMRDPETWKFAIAPALFVKLFGTLVIETPLAVVLYAATRDSKWAAIPFFVSTFYIMHVVAHNLMMLVPK